MINMAGSKKYNNNNIDLKINITKWHSGVDQRDKDSFLKNQDSGILLITPESLESFLVKRKHLGIF